MPSSIWLNYALGSMLVVSLFANGVQSLQASQTEKTKTDATKPARILGIGGVFFKSPHRKELQKWYADHLGIADKGQGAMLKWRDQDDPKQERLTVWSVFPSTTKYFDTSPSPFMINYIVDDLDTLYEKLKKDGVKVEPRPKDESYGKFAWAYDSDGNKIELWQPIQKP